MTDILEKTSDGFFAVDTDWNFTYLNAEAEIMLGAARDSLLGQNIWAKFPDLAGSVFEQNYRAVMSDQIAIEFEALDIKGGPGSKCTPTRAEAESPFSSATLPSAKGRPTSG